MIVPKRPTTNAWLESANATPSVGVPRATTYQVSPPSALWKRVDPLSWFDTITQASTDPQARPPIRLPEVISAALIHVAPPSAEANRKRLDRSWR
jgi:hypothetical protein